MNVKVPNDQGPRESAMCEALAAAAALPKFMVGIPTTLQDPCAAAGLVRHSRGPSEGRFREFCAMVWMEWMGGWTGAGKRGMMGLAMTNACDCGLRIVDCGICRRRRIGESGGVVVRKRRGATLPAAVQGAVGSPLFGIARLSVGRSQASRRAATAFLRGGCASSRFQVQRSKLAGNYFYDQCANEAAKERVNFFSSS
jgi:hypothetical protein